MFTRPLTTIELPCPIGYIPIITHFFTTGVLRNFLWYLSDIFELNTLQYVYLFITYLYSANCVKSFDGSDTWWEKYNYTTNDD